MLQQTSARLQGTERRLITHYRLAVSQRYLKLAEPALRLRILEAGAGPPVLLLHAVGSLATHWLPLLPHLEPFRSVAVDLPGHGLSEGFNYRGVHLRTHAVAVLCSLLNALELPQAAIVANSLVLLR